MANTEVRVSMNPEQPVNVHVSWKFCFPEGTQVAAVLRDVQHDLPIHDHQFMEVGVVISGTGRHFNCLGEQSIGKGDTFLMRPGSWHGYFECENLKMYICCFDLGLLDTELSWMSNNPLLSRLLWGIPLSPSHHGMVLLHLGDSVLNYCQRILDTLCSINEADAVSYQSDRVGLLALLLGALSRQASNPAAESEKQSAPTKQHPAIISLRKQIDHDPAYPWDLKTLAERGHVNPDYFARTFTRVFGISPIAYVNRRRLELASMLLINSDQPINEIANLVGWSDANYFTRRFRTIFGLSPSAYRAQSQKK